MALIHVDAGELRERVAVLELKKAGETGWQWGPLRPSWAAAELSARKNIWSVHGIGATGVTFTMRRQSLSTENALLWRGRHCLITSVLPLGVNHLTVETALVVVSACEDKYTGTTFPGVVTERYLGYEQREPHAVNSLRYLLVTPKQVNLIPGRLVRVDGVDWPILLAHTLDPRHNEYEIERVVDL